MTNKQNIINKMLNKKYQTQTKFCNKKLLKKIFIGVKI